ncbi:unnamed protein product, partial [Heterotrigona itama]
MEEQSNTSIDYYILPNKIFCSMVGIWPIEKSSTFSKIFAYFRLMVTVIAYGFLFVPQILAIAVNWGDIQTIAGTASTSVGQVLYKLVYIAARRDKAHKLYNEMRSLWDSSDDPNEKKSYEQLAYWARIVTIIFSACLSCNVIFFTMSAIINYLSNDSRHLPFNAWYGTDVSTSPKFEIVFFCQIFVCVVGVSGLTGIDCSITTVILHVAGHVVDDINNLITPILFIQLLTSGIEICLSGYAMLDNGAAIIDVLKFMCFFISMTVEILLFCWPGEILVHESEEVGHIIYFNIPWYNLPPIHRRHLCLMIVRAQQYCSITALTFKTLCIQTLTSGSVQSNTSIDYYIRPNKILCSMSGMWPIEEKCSTRSKIFAYSRLIVALTAINSIFVPEIMAIAVNWGDLRILAGVGCVSTTVGQLLFKIIYLIVRKERTYRLYYEIRSLWNTTNDPKDMQSYIKLAHWARICTIIFYLSCLCNVITFSLAAAINYFRFEYNASSADNNRDLPFFVWYGNDTLASPSFEIAFICQFLTSLICAATISGLDATFMTTILHVSGQFKLISTWIADIGVEINCEPNYRRNVVNDVNNLLTPIIFMQLLTSGIEICLSGYAMLDNGTAKADLAKFTSYFLSMLVQLLTWCWPGEILVQESQNIGHVVYLNVPWYNLPLIYQKYLCLVIVRAQQYCSITALTFETLSIHTLTV